MTPNVTVSEPLFHPPLPLCICPKFKKPNTPTVIYFS